MKNTIGLALRLGVGAALGLLLFGLAKSGGQMGWGARAPGDALGIATGVAAGFLAGRRLGPLSHSEVSAPWTWGMVGLASGFAFMAVMEMANASNRIDFFETTPGLRGLWPELVLGGWTGGALGLGLATPEPGSRSASSRSAEN